eukprot:768673-Hanusia_phi.AAC.12
MLVGRTRDTGEWGAVERRKRQEGWWRKRSHTLVGRAWQIIFSQASQEHGTTASRWFVSTNISPSSLPSSLPVTSTPSRVAEPMQVAAPAMNTAMWNHPITSGQIDVMARWGEKEFSP